MLPGDGMLSCSGSSLSPNRSIALLDAVAACIRYDVPRLMRGKVIGGRRPGCNTSAGEKRPQSLVAGNAMSGIV